MSSARSIHLACPHCGEPLELAVKPQQPQPADARPDGDLVALVLATVEANAPIPANDVQRKVRRRRSDVRTALKALEQQERLRRTTTGDWIPFPVPDAPDTPEPEPDESNGHEDPDLDRAERLLRDNADLAAHDA